MTGERHTDARTSAAGGGQPPHAPVPEGMTSFDEVYDQPDPRAYFRALGPLEYQTPQHAQQVFRRAVAARAARTTRPVTVLDVCCSYGINAALLNHDVTLDELYDHYTSPRAAALSTAELIEWDRDYYAARRRRDPARVIGLDMAPHAISYACAVGLLEEGFAENLETARPSTGLLHAARGVQLITITGGTTFLSPRTFRPLLEAAENPVWVVAFVLRTASYAPIAECLASRGLVTEKAADRTFRQRRFTSEDERQHAVKAVSEAGEDPRGKEDLGYFHTTPYLSRPAADAAAFGLPDLLPDR